MALLLSSRVKVSLAKQRSSVMSSARSIAMHGRGDLAILSPGPRPHSLAGRDEGETVACSPDRPAPGMAVACMVSVLAAPHGCGTG